MRNEHHKLQFKKDLLLWEFERIETSIKFNVQHMWRARFLLATLSAAFLGLCITNSFNHKYDWGFIFSLIFPLLLIPLFYLYDCHVNDLLEMLLERGNKLHNKLWDLPNTQYDQLKNDFSKTFEDERDKELKEKFNSFRIRRFIHKLGWGRDKLEIWVYYGIIVLMWVAGFIASGTTAEPMRNDSPKTQHENLQKMEAKTVPVDSASTRQVEDAEVLNKPETQKE